MAAQKINKFLHYLCYVVEQHNIHKLCGTVVHMNYSAMTHTTRLIGRMFHSRNPLKGLQTQHGQCNKIYIHTYIIDHYNPIVRITAWHFTSLMLRTLILYMSGGPYLRPTSTPKDRFLRNFFMTGILILLSEFLARNLLRGNRRMQLYTLLKPNIV